MSINFRKKNATRIKVSLAKVGQNIKGVRNHSFFCKFYHKFIDILHILKLICLMTVSSNLFGFVWVFECDVIGAIIKKFKAECCLFGSALYRICWKCIEPNLCKLIKIFEGHINSFNWNILLIVHSWNPHI